MRSRHVLLCATALLLLVCSSADKTTSHKLVKRQLRASAQRSFPLSRSRQYPPPEELEEDEGSEEEDSQEAPPPPVRRYSYQFRGNQQPPTEDSEEEDYPYTEASTTTTTTTKNPNRISAFNRPRPRFGPNANAATPAPTKPPSSSRSRLTAAPTQRLDVAAEILNKPPPARAPSTRGNSSPKPERKPLLEDIPANRRSGNSRVRARGRLRTRTSTTTTTTTTTTPAPESEEYYYYYYDDEEEAKQPQATTTSTTTTTTTTPKPSLPRRPSLNKNRATTPKPRAPVKFDQDLQFQPPPDDVVELQETSRSTKRFTTSTTEASAPGGIPAHLKGKYKERTDGRFIDYLRDPNRPRELKGFDLSDYPFYVKVPDDIVFDCEDKKDGYYASVPHHCQLFHYCFAGSRYDFLCANYTLYDQTTFTCRFANNVDCPSSEKYYYRNDDLWKETTTMPPVEQKKKTTPSKDDSDYEEEDYEDDDYYYDDEEEDKRRRRPSRRRRNRRRKNKRKQEQSS